MGFASVYLQERAIFPGFINDLPHRDTGIIVVVPSYNEPGIISLIDSLASCDEPECKVEIIVVVNAPPDASAESRENNRKTIECLETWNATHSVFFRLYIIDVTSDKIEKWGVGLARKTGMDEAVRRFNIIDKPDGVILSLDADCKVESNYLIVVSENLLKRKERSACSIYFEHPLTGNDFPEQVYRLITLYELHLRYYLQALAFTGFPYVHHTVGSAIAVKALPYIKAGGMNRKMAGEDFYFIQKLLPAGGYFNLNLTTVYPSPRPSFRVPFGTGATISRLTGSGSGQLLTYNIQAFQELKILFSMTDEIFLSSNEATGSFYSSLPKGIRQFIKEEEWIEKISEIKGNTRVYQSFRKRFFTWFNMFRIVKYLNYVHEGYFIKTSVTEAASALLGLTGYDLVSADPARLLQYYRELEKPV